MIARTATVVLMLGGLAGTVLLVPDGAAPAPAAPASALPPQFAATHAVLLQLRRAWNPNARRRLLAAALADAEHLAAGVLWVLRRPENELLEPAIVLAGELRLPGSIDALRQLLRTAPQLRALVVRTAERVEAWPDLELAELLADDDTQVVLATLAAVLARNAPPWPVLFELLDHRDPAVRDALVAAVPTNLAPALREQLRRIADGFDPLARVAAARALNRIANGDAAVDPLLAALSSADAEVRISALAKLSERGDPIAAADRVWAVAQDQSATATERAQALLCIERTQSFADVGRQNLAFTDHPLVRYCAARCLVACGDGNGARMLVELLDVTDDELVDIDPRYGTELRRGTREVLGLLSGRGPYATRDVYEDWCIWNAAKLRPRRLPPPLW